MFVVEVEVGLYSGLGLPAVGVVLKADLPVLHRPPEPFYEYIVGVPPFPVQY